MTAKKCFTVCLQYIPYAGIKTFKTFFDVPQKTVEDQETKLSVASADFCLLLRFARNKINKL